MGYDIRIRDVASLAEWAGGMSSSVGGQLEAVAGAAGGIAALDDFRGQAASSARAYWGDAVAPVAKALGVAFQDLATRCAPCAEPYTGGEIDSSLDAHLEQGSIQDAAGQLGDMRSDLSRDASDLSSRLEPALGMLGCDAPDEAAADGAISDAATVADDLDKRVAEHESWHSGDCGRGFEAALSGLRGSLSGLGSCAGGASYATGDFPRSSQGQGLARSAAASGSYVGEHREAAAAAMQEIDRLQEEYEVKYAPTDSNEERGAFDALLNGTGDFAQMHKYVFSLFGRLAGSVGEGDAKALLEKYASGAGGVSDVAGAIALVEGFSDATRAKDDHYASHPDLPEDVRESNALAEFDIHVTSAVIDACVPFFSDEAKEAYYGWVYGDPDGDGRSIASDIYDWRYDLYRKGL